MRGAAFFPVNFATTLFRAEDFLLDAFVAVFLAAVFLVAVFLVAVFFATWHLLELRGGGYGGRPGVYSCVSAWRIGESRQCDELSGIVAATSLYSARRAAIASRARSSRRLRDASNAERPLPQSMEVAAFHAFSHVVAEARSAFVVLILRRAYHRQMTSQLAPSGAGHIVSPLMRLRDPSSITIVNDKLSACR